MMTTISEPVRRPPPAEQRVLLQNVSWDTDQNLLADLADQRAVRLFYDKGLLELRSPLFEHETLNRLSEQIIHIIGEELGINIKSAGSTTFKREDQERGFEPDSSYYIQQESDVRDKLTLDLQSAPPPDLVIELDITSSSMDKFSIYQQLGVPEIWRYHKQQIKFYHLTDNGYQESLARLAFPLVDSTSLAIFIEANKTMESLIFRKSCRQWINGLSHIS